MGRAFQLARSQCSDEEIACTLEDETAMTAEEADAFVAELEEQLRRRRVGGQGFMRDYLFRSGTPDSPTAGTLQLATWNSRQILGFTTNGVQGEIDDERKRIEGMTNEELAREHIRLAGDIGGQELDPVQVDAILKTVRSLNTEQKAPDA